MSVYNTSLPPVTVEQLAARVGGELGVSRWFEMPQSRLNAFADAIEDWQFIHVDPEAAKATPFGGTVAHGFLTLSMLSAMAYDVMPPIEGLAMGVNYGFDKVRLIAPVPAGSRIRGRFTLMELERRSETEWRMRKGVKVEIEGGARPALAAEWLSLLMFAPPG